MATDCELKRFEAEREAGGGPLFYSATKHSLQCFGRYQTNLFSTSYATFCSSAVNTNDRVHIRH